MSVRPRGLYETLITEALAADLASTEEAAEVLRGALREADAPDRIALHLSRVVERAVLSFGEQERVEKGIALARALLDEIEKSARDTAKRDRPVLPGSVLHAVLKRTPTGEAETIRQPSIPLLDTTLLTNAPGEPRVGSQILEEIDSSDRIDVIMAFIRKTGIIPLLPALRRHTSAGRALRVLTTVYTGSTEPAALDALSEAGAEIRVSYDTSTTRLHAKGWLFHRQSGFSTAYIGSSNLTYSAQVSGLEWNVRASGARNPSVIDKIAAVFESYWNGGDFAPYDPEVFRERVAAPARHQVQLSPLEVRPEPFQERLLEQIAVSRELGRHRNLLVSATGTGKTVMAAIDYARLRRKLPRARLLFVAHRGEILDQALLTFRQCLREPSFGELWVGGQRPSHFEHVFASIQSITAAGLRDLAPDHFDVVVIDEFHHAAATTYRALLDHLRPAELLGLTATPERSDGLRVLTWFGDRIAAELRLWDAIDQHRLAPFTYFGVYDGLDLTNVPWRRGRGYDVEGLTNLLTANDVWARFVISQVVAKVGDVSNMRALGFCVSIEHARFMARAFEAANISARALWADSPETERKQALEDLRQGALKVLFSVDLLNEGIDLPAVDTLLFLRPTDSPTLFLQQLGRGLRKSEGKTSCTVLDFVGQHRTEFRLDRRFGALLGVGRKELARQVETGFPFLPAGCHLELDRLAAEVVLRSIRESIPSRWPAKVEALRLLRSAEVTLSDYLDETGLEVEDVYDGGRSWTELRREAGLEPEAPGPHEEVLRRACGRLLHIDDRERLEAYRRFLSSDAPPEPSSLGVREKRLLSMLVRVLVHQVVTTAASLEDGVALLFGNEQVRREMLELFSVLERRMEHVHTRLRNHPDVPLLVHARYSRVEIQAAFGIGDGAKVATWQPGVLWVPEARTDLFVVTLDKTSGAFSPTTRYRDYAISRELIHWESQSVTRVDSKTGQRYRNHVAMGSSVFLFARVRADDRAFWFLGPATYVSHEGEQPMAVTWKLEHPLPGDLFAQFAAAVA